MKNTKENIDILREKLYIKIKENKLNDDEIIKLSQELDTLILEYYNIDITTRKLGKLILPNNENNY